MRGRAASPSVPSGLTSVSSRHSASVSLMPPAARSQFVCIAYSAMSALTRAVTARETGSVAEPLQGTVDQGVVGDDQVDARL